jgi:hypothetical protein
MFYTQAHVPALSGSRVTDIKPKANCRFRTLTILFYILQGKVFNEGYAFFKDLLLHKISGPYIKWLLSVLFPPRKFA